MVSEILHKIVEITKLYCVQLTEETIKQNFVTIYQVKLKKLTLKVIR